MRKRERKVEDTTSDLRKNAQMLMHLDASPFREIRRILTEELHRSPEDVQELAFKSEVRETPSKDDKWKSHEPTGKVWVTLTFPDEEKITFEKDSEGVRVGKLPDADPVEIELEGNITDYLIG